ncbi:MAG: hypothetical protein NT072_13065 [Deltaproteobacteria bacterium]|nr:hypothetical protein [Deltaproteobacteria bacterium]
MGTISEKASFLSEVIGQLPEDKEVTFTSDGVAGLKKLLNEINDEITAYPVDSEQ